MASASPSNMASINANLPHENSIATFCLSGPLVDKLRAIADAGFRNVDIFEDDLLRYPGPPSEIGTLCRELGLKIPMYQTFRDFEGTTAPGAFEKNMRRLQQKFDLMDQVGTDLLLLCSSCSPSSSSDRARIVHDLRLAAEHARSNNKRIGYEALSWAKHINTWQKSWDIVREVNHPSLGLVLDTFHIFFSGGDYSDLSSIPGEKIFMVQVADAPVLNISVLDYSRHCRTFPGQGSFPLVPFLRAVANVGYRGPLSLEILNDDFRAAPAKAVAADCMRSMTLLQADIFGTNLLPPLPNLLGVEFIELAISESHLAELEDFLQDLGFQKFAQHRSKNVLLYRSGRVSIVLNYESESHASSFTLLHGDSVCAIAFHVDDVMRTLRRAESLGLNIVQPLNLGPEEASIPAIRAPDDTLYYIVENDSFWGQDFVLIPPSSNGTVTNFASHVPTFTGIDHLSQFLDRLSIDQMVLFLRSTFGLVNQEIFQSEDPFGAPASRALVSDSGSTRFLLRALDEKSFNVSKLARGAPGCVVNHIAFATNDIFEVVDRIRQTGRTSHFLRVPSHYYDELHQRYDLSRDFIKNLRTHNVLYDRDEKGEYLHVSTDQFHDRFFFEFVQRINGYDHFGGVNSSLRTLVQSERRVLNQTVRSRVNSPAPSRSASHEGALAVRFQAILVLFNTGCEEIVDVIADVLGKPKVIVNSSLELRQIDGHPVIGVPSSLAIGPLWTEIRQRDQSQVLLINTHAVGAKDDNNLQMSDEADFEYLYPSHCISRRDVTRFLSFILGQTNKHAEISKKRRTVCLALTFSDVRIALANLDILTVGADAIEFRADLLKEPVGGGKYSDIPSIKYVGEQLMVLRQATEMPIVFTSRSSREGGSLPLDSDYAGFHFYQMAIKWGCEYIDVEVRNDEEIRSDLANRKGNTKMIVSYHDHSGRFKWTGGEIHRRYHEARRHADIVKFVGFANSLSDNYDLEHFRSSVTASYNHPLITLNAGQVGQLSRLFNTCLTTATHPLLPIAGAPGQLSAAEINGALHIIGQLPKKHIYSIGTPRAVPMTQFFEKCFKELGLPHNYSCLERISEHSIYSFSQQPYFGGAILDPPLLSKPSYIHSYTSAARGTGIVDTIFIQREGNQQTLVGDNASAKGIKLALTREFAPAAFDEKPALIVSDSFEEAASAIYALRELGCGTLYTVGFKIPPTNEAAANTEYCNSVERLPHPFVMVSAVAVERAGVIHTLLRIINAHSQPIQGGKVFLDLNNGPRRGDPLGVAAATGWTTSGIADIAAWTTVRQLQNLVGQSVPYDFVRMASGRGLF
ncbi:hypothetical protein DRE_06413 [Drechslerella stenobrocha 248]|uniref:VOC domain-containing protein n=1 Tax=Drechslerella stenobrocha 248 TaxID=1043628 RepID=W7I735_9PEZI|nr:hypothetical protein DRE_06413 [Drechslerella stenobrocha 248]